jgi:hypothetical protein
MVSVTDPYGSILDFLDREFLQLAKLNALVLATDLIKQHGTCLEANLPLLNQEC